MFKYVILMLLTSITAFADDFGSLKELYHKLNDETFRDEKWICNIQKMEPRNFEFNPIPKQTYHCYNYTQEIAVSFFSTNMRVNKIEFTFNNTNSEKWTSTKRQNWAQIVKAKSLTDYADRIFGKFSNHFIPVTLQSKLKNQFFSKRNRNSDFKEGNFSYSIFVSHSNSYKNKSSSHILTMKAQ